MVQPPSGPDAGAARLDADWLGDHDVRAVLAALGADGATARFVGGCVRNAMLGAPVADLDIAIDRPPEETTRLLEAAGIKAIPTGVEHGTITALSPERREPIEITSLRRDVATDGRRAVVAFTRDWAEDAQRRDFTMNALYAEADGRVVDPLGRGLSDLAQRRVRFIGRAADRIREDALRILRFFRFTAWYGAVRDADADDVADIAALTGLISGLARERIGQETKKLLAAADPGEALGLMLRTGALSASLAPLTPAMIDPAALSARIAALMAAERALEAPVEPLRRLAALCDAPAARLTERLRLSKSEDRALNRLRSAQAHLSGGGAAGAAGHRFGAMAARDALMLAAAADPDRPTARASARATEDDALRRRAAEADAGAAAVFPLAAADLIAAGFAPGPALGAALARLREDWIASSFQLDKGALLGRLDPEKTPG